MVGADVGIGCFMNAMCKVRPFPDISFIGEAVFISCEIAIMLS
jgi:hypothetical protein